MSRYQVLTSLKCLASLLVVPFLVNQLAKTVFLTPAIEYLWNTQQREIFLNSYQEDRALQEIQNFSEKTYFESLLGDPLLLNDSGTGPSPCQAATAYGGRPGPLASEAGWMRSKCPDSQVLASPMGTLQKRWDEGAGHMSASSIAAFSLRHREAIKNNSSFLADGPQGRPPIAMVRGAEPVTKEWSLQANIQEKAIDLANLYNKESMLAIVNLLGDLVTFATLLLLFVGMRPQIIILRSFLTESIYSLSDTTKSFLLILVTDLLVGFHSPRGWEIGIEMLLRHLGLPEDQDFIFLFVAAFPVFLDTIFKYWIFRYLNKISPSTVATYHNMIE